MKTNLTSTDLPEQLDGFAGGMGFMSVASITESDLGFDHSKDVKGYISQHINGIHYAEVIDGYGNSEYACGAIDDMQKWITETVYKFCTE